MHQTGNIRVKFYENHQTCCNLLWLFQNSQQKISQETRLIRQFEGNNKAARLARILQGVGISDDEKISTRSIAGPSIPAKQIPNSHWFLKSSWCSIATFKKTCMCDMCVCVCAASSPLQFIYDYLTPGKHGAFSGVRCFFRSLHPVQLLVWHTGYLDVKNNAACDKQHDVWRAAQNKNPKMDQWIIKEWFLVGGFNPSEKYARQIGSFLKGSGWKQQKTWNHHLLFDVQNMDHQRIVCSSLDVQSFRTSKILQNPCHAMEKNAHLSLEISWIQGKNSWVKC